jgi:hypothetical protein
MVSRIAFLGHFTLFSLSYQYDIPNSGAGGGFGISPPKIQVDRFLTTTVGSHYKTAEEKNNFFRDLN